jgi:hypothetical protein
MWELKFRKHGKIYWHIGGFSTYRESSLSLDVSIWTPNLIHRRVLDLLRRFPAIAQSRLLLKSN